MRFSTPHIAPILAIAVVVSSQGTGFAQPSGDEVQVTGPSPFIDCVADFPDAQGDSIRFTGSEVEPFVAVDPLNPKHLVGIWQVDRWNNGAARGHGVAVSYDSGESWQVQPLPKLTLCTGGSFVRATDPWLSFGPTGDLFQMALVLAPGRNAMTVQKSIDGGLSWGDPIIVGESGPPLINDKNSITADPTDPRFVYAVWDRVVPGVTAPAILARSTDGGETFEPDRVIFDPGELAQTIGNQVVVQPDGTVVNFFNHIRAAPHPPGFTQVLSLIYSLDHGATWLPEDGPIPVAEMVRSFGVLDPDTGAPIRDASTLFDVAVDPRDGTLYAVWQDSLLGDFRHEAIAFSQSVDGGFTWSDPLRINQTPPDIPLENQDAFLPSVEVDRYGRVAVTYYDFRFDGDEPKALTDVFAILCQPRRFGRRRHSCNQLESWSGELRLTEHSLHPGSTGHGPGSFHRRLCRLGRRQGLSRVLQRASRRGFCQRLPPPFQEGAAAAREADGHPAPPAAQQGVSRRRAGGAAFRSGATARVLAQSGPPAARGEPIGPLRPKPATAVSRNPS